MVCTWSLLLNALQYKRLFLSEINGIIVITYVDFGGIICGALLKNITSVQHVGSL